MHRHITYYTQSTVCQGGFTNIFLSIVVHGRMQDLPGGQLLFGGGGLATRGIATILLRGFRARVHASPKKKILMVQFGALWSIFS